MKHLLLDLDVIVDVCVERDGTQGAQTALRRAREHGLALWVYVGSAPRLVDAVAEALRDACDKEDAAPESAGLGLRARTILGRVTASFGWLAALADEGSVFESEDPAGEQLLRALDRFEPGSAAILTRSQRLLERAGPRVLTPEDGIQRWQEQAQEAQVPVAFIDLAAQQQAVRAPLERNIHRVLHHGRYVHGPEIGELERRLAECVGVGHCIGVSSGTDALLIALMALGVGRDDEVITTPFTFIATGEVIALVGARPVFVDIDPRTYNLRPAGVEAAMTPRTKAILPVSLYGQCADFDPINALADRHGVPVIEDAAQSFGATYKGRRSGGLSTIGATSFFPSKPLGGYGDGGALFTDDPSLAKTMCEIRDHGQDRRYHHPRLGLNGRLDSLQAAVLLAKLERFDWEVAQRRRAGETYTAMLAAECPTVTPPYLEPHNTSVYAQYTIQLDQRDAATRGLAAAGIPTAIHYPVALHQQPAFAAYGFGEGDLPVAEAAARRVLSLPMHPGLTEGQQQSVVRALCASAG